MRGRADAYHIQNAHPIGHGADGRIQLCIVGSDTSMLFVIDSKEDRVMPCVLVGSIKIGF